jgi:hypothetical protein
MRIEDVLGALAIQKSAMSHTQRALKEMAAAFALFALKANAELCELREEGLTKDEEDAIRMALSEEFDEVVAQGQHLMLLDFVLMSNR